MGYVEVVYFTTDSIFLEEEMGLRYCDVGKTGTSGRAEVCGVGGIRRVCLYYILCLLVVVSSSSFWNYSPCWS